MKLSNRNIAPLHALDFAHTQSAAQQPPLTIDTDLETSLGYRRQFLRHGARLCRGEARPPVAAVPDLVP